jgi:hypothetical protein
MYGIRICITSEHPAVIDAASFDFGAPVNVEQSASIRATITVDVTKSAPQGYAFGDEKGRVSRGIKFHITAGQQSPTEELIAYDGGIFCLWDPAREYAHFWGNDPDILYEKLYLFILSRLGELLEGLGLLRVHGFGINFRGIGVLGMAPSGGGKSTLGWELLKNESCTLLSDDAPLLSSDGSLVHLLPFQFRLGFSDTAELQEIAPTNIRIFKRSKRSDKILLHPHASMIRWSKTGVPLKVIIALHYTKQGSSRIEPMTRWQLLKLLARDLVIGYGLPQVVEFFLKDGVRSIPQRIPLIFQRTWMAIKIARQVQGFHFYQTEEVSQNAALLLTWMEQTVLLMQERGVS